MMPELDHQQRLYDPRDHYWFVGGDDSRAYSSARRTYVPTDDAQFLAWKARGIAPTRIACEVELADVLIRAEASECVPEKEFTIAELLAAAGRVDINVVAKLDKEAASREAALKACEAAGLRVE